MADGGPTAVAQAPRILIENGEYWLSNIGDLAMMDVTIRRLRTRWPAARIGVLTNTPALLRAYFPDADPIEPRASRCWSEPGPLVRICMRAGPRWVGPFSIARVRTKAWAPQKARSARRKARKLMSMAGVPRRSAPSTPPRLESSAEAELKQGLPHNTVAAAGSSSLVLALGGGYVTDADVAQATRVLNLLEHAHLSGTPTVMVGQGLGPVEDARLVARFAEVLPDVAFIGLRERRRGPGLLSRAGVPASQVQVTGDDAIELSFSARREELGTDIGVCLRVAGYSPVSTRVRRTIPSLLQAVARELDAGLVPVIIAEYRSQDRRSTLPLIRGYEKARRPLGRFARPQQVVAQIGLCRVLVTGAYHAAVLAMAQGIPVVALTSSPYYDDKFLGLVDMFGGGLEMVRLDDDGFAEQLADAIRSAWRAAPAVRPGLLASAQAQIAAGRSAFERVFDIVDTASSARGPAS